MAVRVPVLVHVSVVEDRAETHAYKHDRSRLRDTSPHQRVNVKALHEAFTLLRGSKTRSG
eukprot:6198983-Pleurochrysis_carterae.AAC.5